ncbi:hypothetical protein LZ554_003475 [Drepanopeziza brunnea f. sp. 'monogermtubi']|nr:hypothetical protein LZ554_003475 [Drepanopeziza brunnea f. sp. 'monogermtubi']
MDEPFFPGDLRNFSVAIRYVTLEPNAFVTPIRAGPVVEDLPGPVLLSIIFQLDSQRLVLLRFEMQLGLSKFHESGIYHQDIKDCGQRFRQNSG